MDPDRSTLLITLSGNDRPGVTRTLFATLQEHPVAVLDVEQLVVRGRLVLAVLVAVAGDDATVAATRSAGAIRYACWFALSRNFPRPSSP